MNTINFISAISICVVLYTSFVYTHLYSHNYAGAAAGNGTEEERTLYREYFANCDERDSANEKEILKLSTLGRMRTTATTSHNV